MDFRKVVIIFVIAVLFSVFVFSTIHAIIPAPDRNDYCTNNMRMKMEGCDYQVPPSDYDSCDQKRGQIMFTYDTDGCPVSHRCDTCVIDFDAAQERFNMVQFIISAIAGLIAIIIALYTPIKKDIYRWISTGFMLGGLFTLFFGTIFYFGDMARFVRPIVILAELIIVIYLAIRKLGSSPPRKRTARKR